MVVLEQKENSVCQPMLLSPAYTGDLEQILPLPVYLSWQVSVMLVLRRPKIKKIG